MRIIKYACILIAALAFLSLVGSAGAYDARSIPLMQSMIHSAISLAVLLSSIGLATYLK